MPTHNHHTPNETFDSQPPADNHTHARLCVFASGSSGNCSILQTATSAILIDAGLSPRRTRSHLNRIGLDLADIDAILLTHLDSDHFHAGWPRALPERLPVFVHSTHTDRARTRNLPRANTQSFGRSFAPAENITASVTLNHHDEQGTAAFRFLLNDGANLGFATDLGKPTRRLARHMAGVDVLAIESNYSPVMQRNANRPQFLKDRVMGGWGHLSNEECLQLIQHITPREHVVLLHLSQQCNDPALLETLHEDRPYTLTISSQNQPTPWIAIEPSRRAEPVTPCEIKPDQCPAQHTAQHETRTVKSKLLFGTPP